MSLNKKYSIWRYEIDRHTGCIMDSKRESKRDIINLPDVGFCIVKKQDPWTNRFSTCKFCSDF